MQINIILVYFTFLLFSHTSPKKNVSSLEGRNSCFNYFPFFMCKILQFTRLYNLELLTRYYIQSKALAGYSFEK